jgi:hypothetical protein
MIHIQRAGDEITAVLLDDTELDIHDVTEDCIWAEACMDQLEHEPAASFPSGLCLEIHSEDGFGTGLFHSLHLSHKSEGLSVAFECHTPNKFWEGTWGLSTFLATIIEQLASGAEFTVEDSELEDDWKGLTLRYTGACTDVIGSIVQEAAAKLHDLIYTAETALSGLTWKPEYETDERMFCTEVLAPLLRKMRFSAVRYRQGVKEYGKDFTFSELTPFGHFRHYGLQAKAGNVSGGVSSAIDELIHQLDDAFKMPYTEIGSNDPRYISTFIIAISGHFTDNAREKLANKIPKGVYGSAYFLDKENILELIEQHWVRR